MVLGFFVMGGFLLGMDFERLNEFNLKSFYVHKAKRFLPLLLIALGLGVVASAVKHWLLPSEYGLFPCPEYCSASNLSFIILFYNVPLWYMTVYISFIILAPFFYSVYSCNCTKPVIILLLLSVIVSICLYMGANSDLNILRHGNGDLYYSAIYRMWQFVLGLTAAKISCSFFKTRKVNNLLAIILMFVFIGVALMAMILKEGIYWGISNRSIGSDLCAALYFAVIIPCFYFSDVHFSKSGYKIAAYAAVLSYPIYLFHDLIYMVRRLPEILNWEPLPNYVVAISCFLITVAISVCLIKVERKIMAPNLKTTV